MTDIKCKDNGPSFNTEIISLPTRFMSSMCVQFDSINSSNHDLPTTCSDPSLNSPEDHIRLSLRTNDTPRFSLPQ